MRHIAIAITLVVAGCCFGGELGMNEASFSANQTELEKLAGKAEGDLKDEIEAEKKRFDEAYEKLPADEKKRAAALDELWYEQEDVIEKFEKDLEKAAEELKWEGIEKIKGVWQGPGMDLTIDNHGQVAYKRTKGSGSKSINAPVTEFNGDSFEVGALGITTTFKIDKWPYEEDGETKMKVDGVELKLIEEI